MAKGKPKAVVKNRALHSRISFLHQAATYLALPKPPPDNSGCAELVSEPVQPHVPLTGMARRLAADFRAVSLKTRIRLSPDLKQSVCKYCDSVLVEGQSCSSFVENKSKGGKKPWADILVRKCHTCGKEKRYPVSAPRPKRKSLRDSGSLKEPGETD